MTGQTPARRPRTMLALAAGALLLGTVALSGASHVDQANLNLASGGIGFPHRFDIGVVLPDGTVEQADTDAGVDWVVPRAHELVPGHSVTTAIPVFNNTPTLGADTTFEIVPRGADGAVGPQIPNITPVLRFTARTADGTVLFSDVGWQDARGALGVLTSRADDALVAGAAYVPGTAGSEETVTLTIEYPDVPGVEELNGGQSALAVRFHATSVAP